MAKEVALGFIPVIRILISFPLKRTILLVSKPVKKSARRSDPATKGDIADLRKEVKADIDAMGSTLRKEIGGLRAEVKSDMSAMEYRILDQMTLLLEHHRAEIIGATKDEMESLKTRVTRLERHAGLAAV